MCRFHNHTTSRCCSEPIPPRIRSHSWITQPPLSIIRQSVSSSSSFPPHDLNFYILMSGQSHGFPDKISVSGTNMFSKMIPKQRTSFNKEESSCPIRKADFYRPESFFRNRRKALAAYLRQFPDSTAGLII